MKAANELVSVIIPAYNPGELLAKSVESAFAVTHRPLEVIVVDDGSTDGAAQALPPRSGFRYIRTAHRGLAAARNTGIGASKGEFIQFLDADDLLVPSKVEAQVAQLREVPEVHAVYGMIRYFTDDLADSTPGRACCFPLPQDYLFSFIRDDVFGVHAPLFRRNAFQNTSSFDEELWAFQDWELWARMAYRGVRFLGGRTVVGYARNHPDQKTRQSRRHCENLESFVARVRSWMPASEMYAHHFDTAEVFLRLTHAAMFHDTGNPQVGADVLLPLHACPHLRRATEGLPHFRHPDLPLLMIVASLLQAHIVQCSVCIGWACSLGPVLLEALRCLRPKHAHQVPPEARQVVADAWFDGMCILTSPDLRQKLWAFWPQLSSYAYHAPRACAVVKDGMKSAPEAGVALYGAGKLALRALHWSPDLAKQVVCLIDDNADKQGGRIAGKPIVAADRLPPEVRAVVPAVDGASPELLTRVRSLDAACQRPRCNQPQH